MKEFIGKFIGEGLSRKVYQHTQDPTLVIKVAEYDKIIDNHNIYEWEVWRLSQNTTFAKWFAPCIEISDCGKYMVQKKTTPLTPEQIPEKIPNFFSDLKLANFGWYNEHVVCHDYESTIMRFAFMGLTKRMRKFDLQ